MEDKQQKIWLVYSCGCQEAVLCSDSQFKAWRDMVDKARTHCIRHGLVATLKAVTKRGEQS